MNKVKSSSISREFVDSFSHGVRTPLNSIIGFAELLKTELEDDDPMKKYTQQIEQSAISLLEFCDGFINHLDPKDQADK